MSYEKLGFVSGQKLKAEHLNHMEEGIANAGSSADAVLYTQQNLTDEQKAQARENIGAGASNVQSDWNQTDETAPDFIKNKPESLGGGASVQADYLQGDETQPDYVKNRTHHEAWTAVAVDRVETFSPMGDFIMNDVPLPANTPLVVGKTYTIRYNGKTYTAVCKDGGYGTSYLGSDSFLDTFAFEDENDLFCIGDFSSVDGGGVIIAFNEVVTEAVDRHVLIIQGKNTYTHISTEGHFFNIASSGLGYLCDCEIAHEDVMKGMTIQVVIDGVEQTLATDDLVFANTEDYVEVGYNGTRLVVVGIWGNAVKEAIWVDIISNAEAAVKSIDFVAPVFAPSCELKRLDEKFMPLLTSPSGKKFKLTVADDGTLSATEIT